MMSQSGRSTIAASALQAQESPGILSRSARDLMLGPFPATSVCLVTASPSVSRFSYGSSSSLPRKNHLSRKRLRCCHSTFLEVGHLVLLVLDLRLQLSLLRRGRLGFLIIERAVCVVHFYRSLFRAVGSPQVSHTHTDVHFLLVQLLVQKNAEPVPTLHCRPDISVQDTHAVFWPSVAFSHVPRFQLGISIMSDRIGFSVQFVKRHLLCLAEANSNCPSQK